MPTSARLLLPGSGESGDNEVVASVVGSELGVLLKAFFPWGMTGRLAYPNTGPHGHPLRQNAIQRRQLRFWRAELLPDG
ncbi:hypothetical protein GCM10009107_55790 [Ideonella azotifigens]|uniref:Uncharacterized protein n=1 Tax=Ideonella azotifigens TaxID=513160 RepID=A0ABN1KHM6_9BURK